MKIWEVTISVSAEAAKIEHTQLDRKCIYTTQELEHTLWCSILSRHLEGQIFPSTVSPLSHPFLQPYSVLFWSALEIAT